MRRRRAREKEDEQPPVDARHAEREAEREVARAGERAEAVDNRVEDRLRSVLRVTWWQSIIISTSSVSRMGLAQYCDRTQRASMAVRGNHLHVSWQRRIQGFLRRLRQGVVRHLAGAVHQGDGKER